MNMDDYSNKTREQLITICKEQKIKGYSNKKKDEIIKLLKESKVSNTSIDNKKMKGQFYTVNSSYILEGLNMPPKTRTMCNRTIRW